MDRMDVCFWNEQYLLGLPQLQLGVQDHRRTELLEASLPRRTYRGLPCPGAATRVPRTRLVLAEAGLTGSQPTLACTVCLRDRGGESRSRRNPRYRDSSSSLAGKCRAANKTARMAYVGRTLYDHGEKSRSHVLWTATKVARAVHWPYRSEWKIIANAEIHSQSASRPAKTPPSASASNNTA